MAWHALKQVSGGKARLKGGHGIDEIFLLMTPNRLGVIKRGDSHDPAGLRQKFDRLPAVGLFIADVGSYSDICNDWHGEIQLL